MPPVPPVPTSISASAPPPLLPPTITLPPSLRQRVSNRSIESLTTQDIPLLSHRRCSNERPKPYALRSLLLVTLRRLLDSSLNLLLSNRHLVRIGRSGRPITKRFAERASFGLFDPSYLLFAGFCSGEGGGGLVPFGVPVQVFILLPSAHGCDMLVAGNDRERMLGGRRHTSHETVTKVVFSVL